MTINAILPNSESLSAKRIVCIQPHHDDSDISAARIIGVKEQYWCCGLDAWLMYQGDQDPIQRETPDRKRERAGA